MSVYLYVCVYLYMCVCVYQVGRFMTDTDVTVAESSFRQVLENTQVNMAWMDDYYNTISTFLNQNS